MVTVAKISILNHLIDGMMYCLLIIIHDDQHFTVMFLGPPKPFLMSEVVDGNFVTVNYCQVTDNYFTPLQANIVFLSLKRLAHSLRLTITQLSSQ